MKVLIIGGGGREHALAWKLKEDNGNVELCVWSDNAGMRKLAHCLPAKVENIYSATHYVKDQKFDLTIVGPEIPLSMGIVNLFQTGNLAIFGPTKEAAKIESSKIFAKRLMKNNGILTAHYQTFSNKESAIKSLKKGKFPVVIKADGLMAGKGVRVCHNLSEADKFIGNLKGKFLIEEYIEGRELSFIAFTDGETILPLLPSKDCKPLYLGGPNTGGMGAYAPVCWANDNLCQEIMDRIMYPAINGLKKIGIEYQGILYAGLMIQNGKQYVLEFNCRFGDPETQPLMMLLKSDLVKVIKAAVRKELHKMKLEWKLGTAVCVVLSSKGYPGTYETGKIIYGLEDVAEMSDVKVFHAGTKIMSGTDVVTAGGRVLGVCGYGKTKQESIDRTYEAIKKIHFEGMYYRKDIGRI